METVKEKNGKAQVKKGLVENSETSEISKISEIFFRNF